MRSLFVSELKRGIRVTSELKLFHDIVYGFTDDQLRKMVIHTCDIYDEPIRKLVTVRRPMREGESLEHLEAYIKTEVCGL